MRLGVLASCLVASAGCDKILGLEEKAPVIDADTSACLPPGPGNADDDMDGVINDLDPCPRVAYEDASDEDGDQRLDACDLCPQLQGDLAGGDDDCDGIGAACDPEPMAANTRRFFGFASQTGISVYKTVIDGGVARMAVTNADKTMTLTVQEPGTLPAQLVVEATIKNARVDQYWSYEIVVEDAAVVPQRFELQLEKHPSGMLIVALEQKPADLRLANTNIAPLTTNDITFKLVATVTAKHVKLTADITGLGVHVVEADALVAPPVTYGLALNRDANTEVPTTTTAETPYLMFTTLAP